MRNVNTITSFTVEISFRCVFHQTSNIAYRQQSHTFLFVSQYNTYMHISDVNYIPKLKSIMPSSIMSHTFLFVSQYTVYMHISDVNYIPKLKSIIPSSIMSHTFLFVSQYNTYMHISDILRWGPTYETVSLHLFTLVAVIKCKKLNVLSSSLRWVVRSRNAFARFGELLAQAKLPL